ncbi:bifunctional metallophosphatase/5'-nucleotidase [Halovivax limisalsi]|uniref:bifunctional metallophosphatase/5'-nucleotidase n=1 Tax=Halovivax limisalsi TaxID=1453760 RepID=UPI001FFC68EE|nr:5'-nucleotidase C-terminal domain-containing protein [Halovivax limisalsi]
MTNPRLCHLADLETIYDDPRRLARLAGAIEAARDGRTLVVGSGDTTALGALAFESEAGRAVARQFYERIEPDADTLGNHEFDLGVDGAVEWATTTPGTHLVANVPDDAGEGPDASRWDGVRPSTIRTCAGDRIGLIGIAHPETDALSGLDLEVAFTDPVEAVRTEAERLRDRGVDRLVVLSHAGPIDRRIATATDVDAILGGHDHDAVRDRVDGTLVTRTEGGQAGVYQVVELADDPVARTRTIDDGPRVDAVEETYRDLAADRGLTETLGTLPAPLEHSEAAELVADAFSTRGDADVGLVAAASVRDGLPRRVTRGDVIGIVPFGSDLHVHRLSGERLLDLADRCASPLDATHGELITAGLAVAGAGEPRVDGEPIDPDDAYRVGCMSYHTAVDAVPELDAATLVESRGPQYEHVLAAVSNRAASDAVDGPADAVD